MVLPSLPDALLHCIIEEHIVPSQPLIQTARAALVCRLLRDTIAPLMSALKAASQLELERTIVENDFSVCRQAVRGRLLWCTDMNNHRVCGFGPEDGAKMVLRGLYYPWFLAVANGELYVAETSGARISVFSEATGVRVRSWPMLKQLRDVAVAADEEPMLDAWTQGIAVHGGELYAARPELASVSVHDLTSGKVLRHWPVDFEEQFGVSLAVVDERVFVTGRAGSLERVRGVRVYSREGELLDADFGAVRHACSVCALGRRFVCVSCDAPSQMYAAPDAPSLQIFSRDGAILVRTCSFGSLGLGPYRTPLLSADDDRLYISQENQVAVLVFGASAPGASTTRTEDTT